MFGFDRCTIVLYLALASMIGNAVLAVAWGWEAKHRANDSATATVCAAVNTGEAASVELLQARLHTCAADQAANLNAMRDAERARQDLAAQLADRESHERSERDALYQTDPDCGLLARVPVCDAIADRLRAAVPESAGADPDH